LTYVCINCAENLKSLPILGGIVTRLRATTYKNVGNFLHVMEHSSPTQRFILREAHLSSWPKGNMKTPRV
jgi:hypothetical protein